MATRRRKAHGGAAVINRTSPPVPERVLEAYEDAAAEVPDAPTGPLDGEPGTYTVDAPHEFLIASLAPWNEYCTPEQLRSFRERHHLQQMHMATLAGVTKGTYCLWEQGRRIIPPHAARWLLFCMDPQRAILKWVPEVRRLLLSQRTAKMAGGQYHPTGADVTQILMEWRQLHATASDDLPLVEEADIEPPPLDDDED